MTHTELVKLLDILDRIDDECDGVKVGGDEHPYPTAFNNSIIPNHLFTRAPQNWSLNNSVRAEQILKVSSLNRVSNWTR